ncbi:MAG: helix-turn-helix transcriptional regulator [Erythrobacter sp.]
MANEIEQLSMPFLADADYGGSQKPKIERFLWLREVLHRTGLGRSTVYRWMDEGRFPKSVRLGGRSVAWIEHEIDEWLQDCCR